ncbi:unnamed protein product [marine sediment metagenome]|uniref:Uncharacterized protein n=1 Tax=marine sediment metagenome TaxID=412755 RepID=X0U1A2_9ZZZZ
MKKQARFTITEFLLAEFLKLPEGTKIIDVVKVPESDFLEFTIDHDSFPEIQDDQMPPVLKMEYQSTEIKHIELSNWTIIKEE